MHPKKQFIPQDDPPAGGFAGYEHLAARADQPGEVAPAAGFRGNGESVLPDVTRRTRRRWSRP